jgi:NADPH-dependent 2,4-dienoyl-CoA reductase/sulfur reductase-like enzyme
MPVNKMLCLLAKAAICLAACSALASAKTMDSTTEAEKEMPTVKPGDRGVQFHDYCVIGAGPAGLQLGYFMEKAGRDYIIYERNNVSGKKKIKPSEFA